MKKLEEIFILFDLCLIDIFRMPVWFVYFHHNNHHMPRVDGNPRHFAFPNNFGTYQPPELTINS